MIDIFIPYWGEPSLLFGAVESVLGQTSANWRLTVVDDAYPEDVSGYFDRLHDPRVKYIRNEENLGIIGNFAKCQQLAASDYTVFMGCDDQLLPGYVQVIETTAGIFHGVEIIQPGVEVIDESGLPFLPLADRVKGWIRPNHPSETLRENRNSPFMIEGEPLARSLLLGDWLYWPSLAFQTRALKTVEFLPDYQIILDLGLVLDLVQNGARMAVNQERVFAYRRHKASLSSTALIDGPRFSDEGRFFADRAEQMDHMGWHRAARSARLHLTSRLYAATVLPQAVRSGQETRALLTHIFR